MRCACPALRANAFRGCAAAAAGAAAATPHPASARATSHSSWLRLFCWHAWFSFHHDRAALDAQRFAVQEGVGHFFAGAFDDARERRPRNLHLLGCLLLIQAVEIGQPQRLQFVERQHHFFQRAQRCAGRLEVGRAGRDFDPTFAPRSGHVMNICSLRRMSSVCAGTPGVSTLSRAVP